MHILLITRHYPPEVSGGARRPSLYTQALRDLGHRVTIVTPFELEDPDSISVTNKAITRGVRTLQNTSQESGSPHVMARIKSFLRVWAYWPDDNIRWALSVVRTIKHKDIQPDWIMTTSPPESTHYVGRKLCKYLKVPWIAELRDTWVEAPHRQILIDSHFRAFVERRMARKTLNHATAISSVSEAIMGEARRYTKRGTPEFIIGHFSDIPPAPYKFDETKLNLIHTGGFTLSDRRRKLAPLITELEKVTIARPNLVFHIAGPLSVDEIATIKTTRVDIKWHGSVSLQKAKAMQAGADALMLYTPPNSHALPGKYAEYALTGNPILYLGGGDWLNLVEDKSTLLPLEEGIPKITRDQKGIPITEKTHIHAAQKLVEFLESVT